MPKGTTHVGVMATSFSGCTLKINDVIGNMSVVELTKVAKNTVKVSLHESNDGESKATYKIQVDVSEEEAKDGEVVMKEKGVPEDKKVHAHLHSHDGVPCTKDHSKDGEEHGHGHKEHVHSHDDVPCDKDHSTDEERGHGHSQYSHGHGNDDEETKKEEPAWN